MKPAPCTTSWWRRLVVPVLAALLALTFPLHAAAAGKAASSPDERFEAANALYETARYEEAAHAYQALADAGLVSPSLYLNLGNAWFKAGQEGRAVAAYRLGLQLSPRDGDLRFNLRHVRESLQGGPVPESLPSWFARLTLNEWTALFLAFYWIWSVLLVLGEWRPMLRTTLRGYTSSAGMAAALLLLCLVVAVTGQNGPTAAVVATPEAVVRYGPLDESPMHFQLNDGAEVEVLDRKDDWFQIKTRDGREGWLKRSETALVQPPTPGPSLHESLPPPPNAQ